MCFLKLFTQANFSYIITLRCEKFDYKKRSTVCNIFGIQDAPELLYLPFPQPFFHFESNINKRFSRGDFEPMSFSWFSMFLQDINTIFWDYDYEQFIYSILTDWINFYGKKIYFFPPLTMDHSPMFILVNKGNKKNESEEILWMH